MLATRAGIANSSVGLVHSYCFSCLAVLDISLEADADEKNAGCASAADRWIADCITVAVENPLAAPSGEMSRISR